MATKILTLNYRNSAEDQIQKVIETTRDYAIVQVKTRLPYMQITQCLQEFQPDIVQFISHPRWKCRFLVTDDQGNDYDANDEDLLKPFKAYRESGGRPIDIFYLPVDLSCVTGSRLFQEDIAKVTVSFSGFNQDHDPPCYIRVSQCLYTGLKNGRDAEIVKKTLQDGLDQKLRHECHLFC